MSNPRPDLEQLRLLVGIADHKSLGAAARSMGTAQPNASRMLRRLERQLGLSLVVRGPTGSRLTEQGQAVVEWAREVTEATERLVAGAKALAAQTNAQLAIAASMTIAEHLVPRWLSEFRLLEVPVQVNLTVCNSHDVFERIDRGDCGLGFVESPKVPRGLRSTVVGRDELVVIVGPRHPWARRRRPLLPEELAPTPLIVRESGSGTRISLEHHLAGHDLVEPAVELSSNAAVKVMASSGIAPAVMSTLAVAEALATGQLVEVPVEGQPLTRRLRAVWRGDLTAAAADFLHVARAGRTD
jgi:DNA-binding transcriptional LysR family regulator